MNHLARHVLPLFRSGFAQFVLRLVIQYDELQPPFSTTPPKRERTVSV
jgi:hypothetical protein